MRFSRSLLFTSPLLLALAACSSKPPVQIDTPPKAQVVHKDFSQVLDSIFRGQFSYKNGKGYFKPCDDNSEYEIKTETALTDIYKKIAGRSEQPVYIEFSGEIIFPDKDDSDNASIVRIDHVHHMALAKSSLQCAKTIDTFSFKAKGENPYWRINMHNNNLFLATKASNQSYILDDVDFQNAKANHLKSTNQQGQTLLLEVKPGHCYTDDNKEFWGYTTKANTIHGNFSGCGEPGRLSADQLLEGFYLSQSKIADQTQEINLTLNANYTAEYNQGNGGIQILKTGFWKSNTPNQVVLMLTKQGDKTIREEIVFDRKGLALSSREINKNNILTSFPSPLVFKQMNAQHGALETETIQAKRQFTAQRISPSTQVDREVQSAVRDYFKMHRTDPKDTRFNSLRFDLNGDGKDEAIVLLDWCSKTGCDMLIFEAQDKGLHFSSRVSRVQAPVIIAKERHFSWQSLLVESDHKWQQLDFDGLSYPLRTRDGKTVDKAANSTGVVLFNKGKPTTWFPIKE
ncbi:hypothetical protein E2R68_04115 [Psychromonas sp. RZ22]|uniref:hypothetical protein n=1 Tax=Psychromonas algarum TaxID=2555643 RepID=UPI0010677878|nr:hypothetical protein [Psychromonas sp. RZ22]TEW55581.1 hypothetical protein E2R68_04115 [Psychromonas sp. RZ22]